MDASAFALALGTAELAAMTVLGFHHGHAPAAPAATQSMMNVLQTVLAAQLVAKGDLAGLGEIVGPARRDGAEAPAPPTKLPARRTGGGRLNVSIERFQRPTRTALFPENLAVRHDRRDCSP